MENFELVGATARLRLTPDRWATVGRLSSADLSISHTSISRHHARLISTAAGVVIEDLRSTNGTFLNGKKVETATAAEGDEILFGEVSFQVRKAEDPPQPPPPVSEPRPQLTILHQIPAAPPTAIDPTPPRDGDQIVITKKPAATETKAEVRLRLLLEISKELTRQQPVAELLEKIVETTRRVMNVSRVTILLREDGSADLTPRVSRFYGESKGGPQEVPRSIVSKVVEEKIAVITNDAVSDERFKGKSLILQNIRGAMCAPLLSQTGEALGAIYVDNLDPIGTYSGEELDFLISFCGIAGAAIENTRLTQRLETEAIRRSNFERYFAPDLAAQIASEKSSVELGGEKRRMTILFSDIRGFTTLSESTSPDGLATLLNEYFTEMVDIVFEHGGTLDKFIGDCIMANWGAPLVTPFDADRALGAAIEMQRELRALNVSRAPHRPAVEIGIGLNYGEAFVGNVGSPRRMEYTAIGDAVNTAQRLCSVAGPGEIIVSEAFFEALIDKPPVDALRSIRLKGKAKETSTYRVRW